MKKQTGILLIIILLAFSTKAQQKYKSVFDIPVSINITEKQLAEALNEISIKTNVYFSCDASAIVSDRIVTINAYNEPLKNVLNLLFDTSLISFLEKENQIIIAVRDDPADTKTTVGIEINNPEFITLSGQLIDEKDGSPLHLASISVFNKPIGTITNSEGEFILKIQKELVGEPIVLSCLGYSQKIITCDELLKKDIISLHPVSIQIKEVKVTAISAAEILDNVIEKIPENYGNDILIMKAFYRETLKQDAKYINVSEAVIDILKSQYSNTGREDKIRVIKGRKSPDVIGYQWVNFKLMGGPTTMTQLDIVKTMSTFIEPEFRAGYKYEVDNVIWFFGRPVFVIRFKPVQNDLFPAYQGEMYVDRETYAILHVDFGFSKKGLRMAEKSLIRKKPRGYRVKPENVRYQADYRYSNGLCYFYSAKAAILFKVKNNKENINSQFFSVSELLVTDHEKSQVKRFPKNELFNKSDIFAENIDDFDEEFWGNFNILKPDEELQVAIENMKINFKTDGTLFLYNKNYLTKSETKNKYP